MYIAKVESKRELFVKVLDNRKEAKKEILNHIVENSIKPSGIFKVEIFNTSEKFKGKIVSELFILHPNSQLFEKEGNFYIDNFRHKRNIYKLAEDLRKFQN